MVFVQRGRIGKKPSGGVYKQARGKRKFEIGRAPAHTKIGPRQIKHVRTKMAGRKNKIVVCDVANVFDPKTKKFVQAKIKTVKENNASRHFVRRNIMTKGAVIETDAGLARITSRPGQDGTINAVLISK